MINRLNTLYLYNFFLFHIILFQIKMLIQLNFSFFFPISSRDPLQKNLRFLVDLLVLIFVICSFVVLFDLRKCFLVSKYIL